MQVRATLQAIAIVLALGIVGFCFSAEPAKTDSVRIAIVPLSKDSRVQAITDLAEALSSKEPGRVVVERKEIDRILSEQKLTLATLCNPDHVVTGGKLLKADLLILPDAIPEVTNSVSVVIFETRYGRRLWDEALVSASISDQAAQMTDRVSRALAKQQGTNGITMCMLDSRNADLPRAKKDLGEAVTRLLERRLVSAPNIMLLERAHLEEWRREQRLASSTSDKSDLLSSAVLVEVEIARGPEKDIKCTAYLSDGAGKILQSPSIHGDENAGDLADALSVAVCSALHTAKGVENPDPHVEAKRFTAEAVRRSDHYDEHYDASKSYSLMMAAMALDPSDKAIRMEASIQLVDRANRVSLHEPLRAIDYVDQAVDLALLNHFPDARRQILADMNILYFVRGNAKGMLASKATHGPFIELQKKLLRYYKLGEDAGADNVDWGMAKISACSASSADYVRIATALVRRWMAHPTMQNIEWDYRLQRMPELWLRPSGPYPCTWRDTQLVLDGQFYGGLHDLCAEMAAAKDPLVHHLGDLGILIHDAEVKKLDDTELIKRWETFRSQIEPYIKSLKNEPKQTKNVQRRRSEAYWMLLDAADLVRDPGRRFELIQQVFDMTMANKDFSWNVGVIATSEFVSSWRCFDHYQEFERVPIPEKLHDQIIANCEKILDATSDSSFEQPDPYGWQRENDRFRQQLADYRSRWKPQQPSAAIQQIVDLKTLPEIASLNSMIFVRDSIYLIGTLEKKHGKGSAVRLMRIDPNGGNLLAMGDAAANFPQAMAAGKEGIFVGSQIGLWLFPLDDSKPRRLGEKQLPSRRILSVAVVGDDLFLGTGGDTEGTHFLRYNPRTEEVEILASSERRETKTPFDNIHPGAFVRAIYPDLERNRLLLTVDRGLGVNNFCDYMPLIGIWAFDLKSGKLSQIVECNRAPWSGQEQGGKFLYSPWSRRNPYQPGKTYRPWYGAIEFDMTKDSSKVLCSFKGLPAGPELRASDSALSDDTQYCAPFLQQSGLLFFNSQWLLNWIRPPNNTPNSLPMNPTQLLSTPDGKSIIALGTNSVWRIDSSLLSSETVAKPK